MVRDLERRLGATITIGYGQSESASISQTSLYDSAEDKATTIGRPLPHREVAVRRIGDGGPGNADGVADVGEVGEIWTRSRLVFSGYLQGRDEEPAGLDADGWLHTGDLAEMDERGLLTFRGRLRDVIIRGGENIYPGEVEEVLVGHADVAEAVVVGFPDPVWGEQVAAFVRLVPGAVLAEADLRQYARRRMAPFKVPVVWREVGSFPLTASAKVRRNVLRDRLVSPSAGD